LSIPVNLRFEPERRLSVGYTASNSYLNDDVLFLNLDVRTCAPRFCRVFYETDHTGNLLFVDYTQPLLEKWEFGFGLASYELDEPFAWSPLHQLVNDSVLASFHEHILHEDSLPVRSQAPNDRLYFSLTDYSRRTLVLRPEHRYALPLRLDLSRYVSFKSGRRGRMGLNVGIHLSYPLEGDLSATESAFARSMDIGVAVNFVRSLRLTPNLSSTFHVELAKFRSSAHVVNPNSPVTGDDGLRSQYALTYGLRFAGTFGGKAPCSFSMAQLTTTAEYDKQSHNAADYVVFEGGNNLRGALAGANDYGVLSFACEYRRRQLQVSFIEDIEGLSQIFTGDGSSNSYDTDFAVSLSASWELGAPRSARAGR
jgi:hypothetical protein